MNQARTVRTPIHREREIRQERKARELENETLPGYAKRNLNHWFNPAEQIISLDQPIENLDGATGSIYWSLTSPHRRLRSSVNKTVKMLPLG